MLGLCNSPQHVFFPFNPLHHTVATISLYIIFVMERGLQLQAHLVSGDMIMLYSLPVYIFNINLKSILLVW